MRAAAAIAALVALALPATAGAETFRGETVQGKPVTIKTKPTGELRKGTWRWKAGCERKDLRLRTQTTVLKSAKRSEPGYFKAKGSYTARFRDANIRFTVWIEGRRKRVDRWAGTFKAKARVKLKRGGRALCTLRRVRWAATN